MRVRVCLLHSKVGTCSLTLHRINPTDGTFVCLGSFGELGVPAKDEPERLKFRFFADGGSGWVPCVPQDC